MTARSVVEAKERGLEASFDRVAAHYDLLCRLNRGYRTHLRWSAERLGLEPRSRILDLCCGTGLSTAALVATYPEAEIVGLDMSRGMLAHARSQPELSRVTLIVGNAMDPAAAGAHGPFDGILMAYGLRNVPDPDPCLRRLHDLLAPGGVLCVHEYSVADSGRSRFAWNVVTRAIVMPLALVVTGSTNIFRYLRRSVLEFDGVRGVEARLRHAGFVEVETLPMDGWQRGITHTFRGRKPGA